MSERRVTAAGARPDGDGWVCIHSWANWEGRWWLWQRLLDEDAEAQASSPADTKEDA